MDDETVEGICGWCEHFVPLTDEDQSVGVCELAMGDELGRGCMPMDVLAWAYENGLDPDSEACEMWEEAK